MKNMKNQNENHSTPSAAPNTLIDNAFAQVIPDLLRIEEELLEAKASLEQHNSKYSLALPFVMFTPIVVSLCGIALFYVFWLLFIPFLFGQNYTGLAVALFALVFFSFAIVMGIYCFKIYLKTCKVEKLESKKLNTRIAELNKEKQRVINGLL